MHDELGDTDDCIDRWAGACTREATAPGSGFSDDKVLACSDGIYRHSCGTFRRFEDLVIPACHPKGKLANGAACLDHAQCGSTFCSRSPNQTHMACGVCAPRAPSGGRCWQGMPDGVPRQGCQVGEVCSRSYCLGPMNDEGESCGPAAAWASNCYGDFMTGEFPFGLGCSIYGQHDGQPYGELKPPDNAMGRCVRHERPEKCSKDDFECEPPYFCSDGLCQQARLVRPGERCDERRERCLAGTCEKGVCKGKPVAGDACDVDEMECSFPFVCVNGACALTDPACGGKP
jgi:hypothetical protein